MRLAVCCIRNVYTRLLVAVSIEKERKTREKKLERACEVNACSILWSAFNTHKIKQNGSHGKYMRLCYVVVVFFALIAQILKFSVLFSVELDIFSPTFSLFFFHFVSPSHSFFTCIFCFTFFVFFFFFERAKKKTKFQKPYSTSALNITTCIEYSRVFISKKKQKQQKYYCVVYCVKSNEWRCL